MAERRKGCDKKWETLEEGLEAFLRTVGLDSALSNKGLWWAIHFPNLGCGGLKVNGLHRLIDLNTCSQRVTIFERIRRCGYDQNILYACMKKSQWINKCYILKISLEANKIIQNGEMILKWLFLCKIVILINKSPSMSINLSIQAEPSEEKTPPKYVLTSVTFIMILMLHTKYKPHACWFFL
jgi:hypothetical protein